MMTSKAFAFTFVVEFKWVWRSPVCAHLVSRAWVVKEDKEHFAPEMPVHLVIDEGAKGTTCLSKCGGGTDVAEKGRKDDDLFYEFRREQAKRSPEARHMPHWQLYGSKSRREEAKAPKGPG